MTENSDALLRELLKLYGKYGSTAFEESIERLRKGVVSTILADSLREVAIAAQGRAPAVLKGAGSRTRKPAPKSKTNSRELLHKYIEQLKSSGKADAALISSFVEEIAQGSILDSPVLLRKFVEMIGLFPAGRRSDRNLLARQIGEYLVGLPPAEVRERISVGRGMRQANSSLAGWTQVIVRED